MADEKSKKPGDNKYIFINLDVNQLAFNDHTIDHNIEKQHSHRNVFKKKQNTAYSPTGEARESFYIRRVQS